MAGRTTRCSRAGIRLLGSGKVNRPRRLIAPVPHACRVVGAGEIAKATDIGQWWHQPDWLSEPAAKGCDDAKVVQLLDTQSYFELLSLPYPSNRPGVLERFASEGLIHHEAGGWTISNLGAVLFAKRLDLFDRLIRKSPRVIVYEGKGKPCVKRSRCSQRSPFASWSPMR